MESLGQFFLFEETVFFLSLLGFWSYFAVIPSRSFCFPNGRLFYWCLYCVAWWPETTKENEHEKRQEGKVLTKSARVRD